MPATSPVEFEPQVAVATVPPPEPAPVPVRWNLATRVAFRFTCLYFTLYVVCTQMLGALLVIPNVGVPHLGTTGFVQNIVKSVAANVLGISYQWSFQVTGSGDKTADWAQAFTLLLAAAAGTIAWSILDRRRVAYAALNTWFRLFLRFSLGATMVSYGVAKAIPLQMPAPGLTRLVEPFGHFSPMGVLWYSIGASRPYEIFTGCAELLAGVLLFIPQTATLGAMVALADTTEIFTLNMTYDVPVKLFSFHLIVMSLVLLAPDARRLASVLVLNRAAGPSTHPPLFRGRRAARAAVALQLLLGAYIVGMGFDRSIRAWSAYGGGAPKSPLYGIWNVEEMQVDGVFRSPLVTDYGRWRRVIFDRPTAMSFQRMDDTFANHGAAIDTAAKTIALTKGSDRSWKAQFTFDRPDSDTLVLDGDMDGHRVRMRARLFDREKFLLVSRGFNWIQEFPFNR